ncbi:MAG: hypothetical protein JNK15_06395 [Planctomycetes bacterium]|nr:hypothetical protein [Planctomycetota bacterium]
MDSAPADWPRRRLWAFRIGVALFGLQFVVSAFGMSPTTRAAASWLAEVAMAPVRALAPEFAAAAERRLAGNDGLRVVAELARDLGLSVVVAAVWRLCSRRTSHERMAGFVRVALRYLVGTVMAVYGGFKVVPVQFPLPAPEQLQRPLAEFSPMGLLWVVVGSSPAYVVFGGVLEWVGAGLLFWRRTTTLGALLLTGVLANVVALNFCYDVPVKRAATLLLVAVVVLASRDLPRLWDLLFTGRPVPPALEPPFAGGRTARRWRCIVKSMWVATAMLGSLVLSLFVGNR